MRASSFVTAGLVALTLAGSALAHEARPQQDDVQFEQLDRNGDGFLSRDEVATSAQISAHFEKADLNRDGRLDRGEFRALLASLRSPDLKTP